MKWTRRDLTDEELSELSALTDTVAQQLRDLKEGVETETVYDDTDLDLLDRSLSSAQFREMSDEYISRAEMSVKNAVEELEYRKKEVAAIERKRGR